MRKVLIVLLGAVLLTVIYFNYSLYYHPTFEKENNTELNEDVYHQLQFLKAELLNGAGDDMQSIFPEGFIFINSLYGLS